MYILSFIGAALMFAFMVDSVKKGNNLSAAVEWVICALNVIAGTYYLVQ